MNIVRNALVLCCACLFIAAPADAKIKLEFQLGADSVEAVEDLPETPFYKVGGRYVDYGYHYKVWSVNRIPFWAWSGEGYVLYVDDLPIDTIYKVSPETQTELTRELGHDPRGTHSFNILWYLWGWVMVAFVVWVGRLVHLDQLKKQGQLPPAAKG